MANVHCKACDNRGFRTVSALRKHQWEKHREFYANTGMVRTKSPLALEPARPPETFANPMTAIQLLEALRTQQTFINDVVTLVEGLIK